MAWLTGQTHVDAPLNFVQEAPRHLQIELEFRRQLDQQHGKLGAEPLNLLDKWIEYVRPGDQLALVRQRAWRLYGETEMRRHAGCPTSIGLHAMVAIKRAIAFHRIQPP